MDINISFNASHERVTLRSGWRSSIAAECKQVAGASWSKTQNEWSYPLSMYTLRRLREVFGGALGEADHVRLLVLCHPRWCLHL